MSPDKAMIGYLQARIAELEAEVERAGQLLAAAVTMIAQRYDVSPEEARKAIEIMLQLQDRDAARKERGS